MSELFEKFGEFDSVEELNRAAAGQLEQGDIEALKLLAKENGIEEDDVEDYIDGCVDELATLQMAAYGRIAVEEKQVQTECSDMEYAAVRVIAMILKTMCTDTDIAAAVMKKGKRIKNIYNSMRNEAEKHKSGNIGVSCGTDRQLQDIIKSYYTKSKEEFEKTLDSLYS